MKLDYVSIGGKIRILRKVHGWSQEKLAELVGVSIPHMSNIENGKTQVSFQKFWELVNVLGTTPDKLLIDQSMKADREDVRRLLIDEIVEVLADCSVPQMVIIKESLCLLKEVFRKYGFEIAQDMSSRV